MLALVQTLYTAEVTAKNGRNGHVRSADGSVDLDLSAPAALGGTGKPGANPEQLFAAGYSACFIGAMQYQAMQQKLKPGDITIDAKVSIGPAEGDNGFTLAVALDVHVAGLDSGCGRKARRRRPPHLPLLQRHPRQHPGKTHRARRRLARTARPAPWQPVEPHPLCPSSRGNRPVEGHVPPFMPAIRIDVSGAEFPGRISKQRRLKRLFR